MLQDHPYVPSTYVSTQVNTTLGKYPCYSPSREGLSATNSDPALKQDGVCGCLDQGNGLSPALY